MGKRTKDEMKGGRREEIEKKRESGNLSRKVRGLFRTATTAIGGKKSVNESTQLHSVDPDHAIVSFSTMFES